MGNTTQKPAESSRTDERQKSAVKLKQALDTYSGSEKNVFRLGVSERSRLLLLMYQAMPSLFEDMKVSLYRGSASLSVAAMLQDLEDNKTYAAVWEGEGVPDGSFSNVTHIDDIAVVGRLIPGRGSGMPSCKEGDVTRALGDFAAGIYRELEDLWAGQDVIVCRKGERATESAPPFFTG